MSKATKTSKSFSIDRELHAYLVRTKGRASASQRLNALLRRAVLDEERERLEQEAATFFASLPTSRKEERAFQRATRRSLTRD
jgi:hypothetical protein